MAKNKSGLGEEIADMFHWFCVSRNQLHMLSCTHTTNAHYMSLYTRHSMISYTHDTTYNIYIYIKLRTYVRYSRYMMFFRFCSVKSWHRHGISIHELLAGGLCFAGGSTLCTGGTSCIGRGDSGDDVENLGM